MPLRSGVSTTRLRRFFSYYRPYLGLFAADILCAFIVAGTTLLLPLLARHVTQIVLDGKATDSLTPLVAAGMVMLALILVQALAALVVDYRGHLMGALMERDLRAELLEHYQKLSFSFYDEEKTGRLMARITNDSWAVSELFHHGPEDIAIAALKFLGAFAILLHIHLPLTLIVFLFLPVMAAYAFHFYGRMARALRKTYERIGDINAQVEDTLSGIRVVKSFTNERIEAEKFAHANGRFVDSRREGYRSEAYFSVGLLAFTQVITVAVILFGGLAIVRGSLNAADLVAFLMCVAILIDPIQRAVNITRLLQEGVTGFNRIMDVMDIPPDIEDSPRAVELARVQGDIQFVGVSFRYREERDDVLRDVWLHIRAGEYVALVGTSGVGKSTLCSLIPRFYDVSEGSILLDGNDVRDVTLRSLRRNIGVVQQDVYLFAGTVLDNIRYGRPDATREAIIDAATMASAHDFIMQLPDGYDTEIGQRGVKLSGGQKQRLSIARVFLKDPPVIIFDEATSALDNESEKAVQESMMRLTHNRTVLVIAHRLSTIRNAQRIVVLSDSGIAEQGTHDDLLARGGVYAELYRLESRL
ncbi:MAG: ABC transporter ATP-binding protein [Anaerolineae bacterium]|nr:ABC transporter ATP-binding protein [Anaerolineae bacterium]